MSTELAPRDPDPRNDDGLLHTLFSVRRDERVPLLLAFLYFFCVLASYYVLRPIRDEMGVAGGVANLPWLFLGTLSVTALISPLFSRLVARLPRRAFVAWAYRAMIVCLLAFWVALEYAPPSAQVWIGRVFFVWLAVFAVFVVSLFWAVMSDVFHTRQARRLYGVIGAGGTLGGMVGGLLTGWLVHTVGSLPLLLIAAVLLEAGLRAMYALSSRVAAGGDAQRRAEREVIGGSMWAGLAGVVRSPYLAAIATFMLLFTIGSTFLYFLQAEIVAREIVDRAARTAYFAQIDVWVNGLTLVLQLVLTGRLMSRIGVGAILALVPLLSIAGFLALAAAPLLSIVIIVQVLPHRQLRADRARARSAVRAAVARRKVQSEEFHRHVRVPPRRPARCVDAHGARGARPRPFGHRARGRAAVGRVARRRGLARPAACSPRTVVGAGRRRFSTSEPRSPRKPTMIDRRDLLKLGTAAAAAWALRGVAPAAHAADAAPSKPLRILILGGTGFTGPHQVRYALQRGHKITLFNRGRKPKEWPGEVEELVGDRNTGDLASLQGREWDVCIDNPTTLPFWVRDVGRVLKGKVGQYVFISTISVYAANDTAGADEEAPTAKYDGKDAMAETQDAVRANMALYGPLKARSEEEVRTWFKDRATVIRPGLIVGPGDETDRFTYWPARVARGGEVLAPGSGNDPVQFIDARDLAEWTIRMAEQKAYGTYNATGPDYALTMAQMLHGIRAVTTAGAQFTWVPADFLAAQKVAPWGDMPVWIPAAGDSAGFASRSIKRALGRGLTFRTLATTAGDTLAWLQSQPAERQAKLRAGLSAEREQEVLAAWKKKT